MKRSTILRVSAIILFLCLIQFVLKNLQWTSMQTSTSRTVTSSGKVRSITSLPVKHLQIVEMPRLNDDVKSSNESTEDGGYPNDYDDEADEKPDPNAPKVDIKSIDADNETGISWVVSGNKFYSCDSNNTTPRILIAVHSAYKNVITRRLIRQSWGQSSYLCKFSAKLLFFIAQSRGRPLTSLREELKQHDDVITLDFIDSYLNLSRKSVESMRWINKHLPDVKYVLKQDDDAFVNMTKLTRALKVLEHKHETTFIAGYYFPNRKPKRNPKNVYYTPHSLWNKTHWPPAVTGPAYVITGTALPRLVSRADMASTPQVLWEDIFVTSVVRSFENITLFDIRNMRHVECRRNYKINPTAISYHRVKQVAHQDLFQHKPCSRKKPRSRLKRPPKQLQVRKPAPPKQKGVISLLLPIILFAVASLMCICYWIFNQAKLIQRSKYLRSKQDCIS